MSYSTAPLVIVIDANVAIQAILPVVSNSIAALEQIENWHLKKNKIIAPDIWLPEVTSVIRRGVYQKVITNKDALQAIEDIFALGVEIIPTNARICQDALVWAERLSHSKAYDSFYLALASARQAQFWTADKRLVRGAKQIGVSWIHYLET